MFHIRKDKSMNLTQTSSRWLLAHTLAIGFSLAHLTLDWHLDLFGAAETNLSFAQAATLLIGSSVYALWAMGLSQAGQGKRNGMWLTIYTAGLGGLGNGLSIVFCPPICGAAFPYGDLSHIGSLVFGVWAIYESWRALKLDTQSMTTLQRSIE
jgi:hypothetical protein